MTGNGSRPRHVPVLLEEALCYLAPDRGGCFVDCTLGLGGHAAALLEGSPGATLIGVDRDRQALAEAAAALERFGDRVRLVSGRFSELESLLSALGVGRVSGILADLGVSSLQLEVAERGFSFQRDGPLDMRMEKEGEGMTAEDVLRTYPERELRRILGEFGEERHAKRIAGAIAELRSERPLRTTEELRHLIERVKPLPPGLRRGRRRRHPATQTFQALRIEVNQELDELRRLLATAARRLESDGRMVLISYHSLEDRIVKHTFRDLAAGEIEPVTGRPRAETRVIEVLTRKPARPRPEEVDANPRSRSARLRAARRL